MVWLRGTLIFFGSPRVTADAPYPRRKLPAGFLISSAEDIGHYLIAQLNDGSYGEEQILSPDNVEMMHQPAVETGSEGVSYAFGWRTNLVEGEPIVRHGGDTSNFHSDMAFSPTRGWGVAVLMNYTGAPILHVLNEPVNEVLRMASGFDTGHSATDSSGAIMIVWGIIILLVVLNIVLWSIFYWRRWQRGSSIRLVWHFLLPLTIDFVLIWLIISFVPNLLDSTLPIFLVFAPDLGLILLVCAAAVGLMGLARVVVYILFIRRGGTAPTGQYHMN